jgi:hypothetical protein
MDPFQSTFVVILPAGVANDGTFTVVPAAKRAVIEHASVYANPPSAAATGDYFVTSTIDGNSGFREVPLLAVRTGSGAVVGSHPLRAYADPGTEFGAVIRRSDTSQELQATFVLAGYYLPVAISP